MNALSVIVGALPLECEDEFDAETLSWVNSLLGARRVTIVHAKAHIGVRISEEAGAAAEVGRASGEPWQGDYSAANRARPEMAGLIRKTREKFCVNFCERYGSAPGGKGAE